jgi:ribosomal protein S18 acetylase RimI-like enzyme
VSGIRAVVSADGKAVNAIAIETGLFTADDIGGFKETLQGFLDGSLSDHRWIVLEDEANAIVGAAYYAPEPFSDRMWNLYFIGVRPARHGAGVGTALVAHVEATLRGAGEEIARTLIVETSSLERFGGTRAFYERRGFIEEARIREFYGPGEDKIVFWKSLLQ